MVPKNNHPFLTAAKGVREIGQSKVSSLVKFWGYPKPTGSTLGLPK